MFYIDDTLHIIKHPCPLFQLTTTTTVKQHQLIINNCQTFIFYVPLMVITLELQLPPFKYRNLLTSISFNFWYIVIYCGVGGISAEPWNTLSSLISSIKWRVKWWLALLTRTIHHLTNYLFHVQWQNPYLRQSNIYIYYCSNTSVFVFVSTFTLIYLLFGV